MSKQSRSRQPSVGKVAKQPDVQQVVKEIRKLVPKKTIDIKPVDTTIQPPVKPEKTMTKPVSRPKNPKKNLVSEKDIVKTRLSKRNPDLSPGHDKYFVYLNNPLEYRRHLLESSRKILFCLRNYQRIALIRQKKLDEMKRLKASLKELTYLGKKFTEMLPQYNVDFLEDMPVADKKAAKRAVEPKAPKQEKIVEPPREKTELDKLEDSLAKIEAKLKGLK